MIPELQAAQHKGSFQNLKAHGPCALFVRLKAASGQQKNASGFVFLSNLKVSALSLNRNHANMPALPVRNMSSFGEKLRKLRKEKGWSQDELAEKIGIHGRHVGKYEAGKVLPNAETLIAAAAALEVSLDYLLLDSNGAENPAAMIRDRELLKDFEVVDHMDEKDRDIIKSLIDAFIKKKQIEAVMGDKTSA
jgi:transcriptional regulator with XRE-family HTH domain